MAMGAMGPGGALGGGLAELSGVMSARQWVGPSFTLWPAHSRPDLRGCNEAAAAVWEGWFEKKKPEARSQKPEGKKRPAEPLITLWPLAKMESEHRARDRAALLVYCQQAPDRREVVVWIQRMLAEKDPGFVKVFGARVEELAAVENPTAAAIAAKKKEETGGHVALQEQQARRQAEGMAKATGRPVPSGPDALAATALPVAHDTAQTQDEVPEEALAQKREPVGDERRVHFTGDELSQLEGLGLNLNRGVRQPPARELTAAEAEQEEAREARLGKGGSKPAGGPRR